jgi:hypothetical protein
VERKHCNHETQKYFEGIGSGGLRKTAMSIIQANWSEGPVLNRNVPDEEQKCMLIYIPIFIIKMLLRIICS